MSWLLPCGSQGLNSGHWAWRQVSLPSEPSRWPLGQGLWVDRSLSAKMVGDDGKAEDVAGAWFGNKVTADVEE